MLSFMRKHKKYLVITLWLVIFSFIFLYTNLQRRARTVERKAEIAVTIGDESISRNELARMFSRFKKNMNAPENDPVQTISCCNKQ